MLYFKKSQPAPDCLSLEKKKNNGNYRCGCVVERLDADFEGKCYICGNSGLYSINIEHFFPHRNVDKDLKFYWDNLFLSCSHCNNIKSDKLKYHDILNCTDLNDLVEDSIGCYFIPFPGERVVIKALRNDPRVTRTVVLIEDVFNGSTSIKTLESASIRDSLLNEMIDFLNSHHRYFKRENDQDDKDEYRRIIKRHLSKSSKFSSFKRRVVLENELLFSEFGHLIN